MHYIDHDYFSIKRIDWLNVTIDGEVADQAIGSPRFAGFDQPRKVRRTAFRCQLVRLYCSHNVTLSLLIRHCVTSLSRTVALECAY